MKPPALFALMSFPLLMVSARAADQAAASPPEAVRTAPAQAPARPALAKGMTAEAVIQVVGKPFEVKPMASAAGRAEIWIYRRVARKWTQQTAAGMDSVPMFTGLGQTNDGMHAVSVPSQKLEQVTIYQVTSLLMFDGRLVEATQRLEKEQKLQ